MSEHRTITASEARSRVLRCFNAKRPLFLWGPPGIGKSELVAGIADELGGHMIDLRLGQVDQVDIRGIPFFNKELNLMDWAPPIDLPSDELAAKYPVVVLFLDEMNTAAPAVQAAAYQLILNRRIGKYVLPDNVAIVAAGNRESDKGVTFRMPTPLANRFVHLEIRPDFDSWQQWALENHIHKDVIGYLGFAKQDMFDFDPRSSSRSFATPRSWTFVSQFLEDKSATDAELMDLIAGTIGEGLAAKFMAHRKVAGEMPKAEDVLAGKVTELKVKEVSAMYSLTISLCYELEAQHKKLARTDINKWYEMCDIYIKFMMDNFMPELIVMGLRTALVTYSLPMIASKIKNFAAFDKKYGKYISPT